MLKLLLYLANIILMCYYISGDIMSDFFSYRDSDIYLPYRQDISPDPTQFKTHTHETYELYCFFEGKGIYRVEGTPYPLEPGDILIMRPAEAHCIDISGAKPYTRFSVHFNPKLFSDIDPNGTLLVPFLNRTIGTYNRYRAENFKTDAYSIFIKNMIANTNNRRVQIITNLLPLLNEISVAFESITETKINQTLDSRIINYINRHLEDDLNLDNICDRYYISKSHLCHIFKRATASTVGEYITVKRLVKARQLLLNGVPPTKAYQECGFKDYSAFYRAFKKKYGTPPSKM